MHICPAEIAATLFIFEQAVVIYWYARMRIQGLTDALKQRISS